LTKRLPTTCAVLALALPLLGGCGDDETDSANTTPPPTEATGPATTEAGATITVSMKDIKYEPETVNAKVGQTVKWTNDDPVAHTVTSTGKVKFDSGTVNAGGTYEQTVKQAGTIDYVCTIHPNQKGKIVVQ